MRERFQIARRLAPMGALLVVCLELFSLGLASGDLTPRWTGDFLQISAPKLHFLTGKPLERLRNGAAVPFDFQLTLSSAAGAPALYRSLERFVVSYDLWEEKFSVIRLRNTRRSGLHLSASAAEAWCLDNIAVPAGSVPTDRNLWLKLEIRSAESKPVPAAPDDSGVSLTTLVEIFSRPTRDTQDRWQLETGPFRVADLRR